MKFLVHSRHRESGSSHNFRWRYPGTDTLQGNYEITDIALSNNFRTIDTYNNKIYYDVGGTDYTATIASGYYDSTTILAAVKTAMDADNGSHGKTYTVTYSETTRYLNIAQDSGTFSLTFGTNTSNTARHVLGWSADDTTAATNQTANQSLNLSGPSSLHLSINGISKYRAGPGTYSTFYLTLDAATGQFITRNDKNEKQPFLIFETTEILEIKLRDVDGNIIDLNGGDIEFMISSH